MSVYARSYVERLIRGAKEREQQARISSFREGQREMKKKILEILKEEASNDERIFAIKHLVR